MHMIMAVKDGRRDGANHSTKIGTIGHFRIAGSPPHRIGDVVGKPAMSRSALPAECR